MAGLEKLTQDESKRYKGIFSKLDARAIDETRKRSYLEDNDGGVYNNVASVHSSYMSSNSPSDLSPKSSEEAHKMIDSYVTELLSKLVKPETYNTIKETLDTIKDPEERRFYLHKMAEKNLNLDERTLKQKHSDLMAHGKIDYIIHDISQKLNDPENGLANYLGTKDLINDVQKEGDATKALTYFNDNILKKKGYELDRSQIAMLGYKPQEAIGLMQNVMAGVMTPSLVDKYGLKET